MILGEYLYSPYELEIVAKPRLSLTVDTNQKLITE